jgi:hypothetical protein
MKYDLSDNDLMQIAAMTYGENRGQGDAAIIHTASSAFNRLGKNEWRNLAVPDMLKNGYYAVSHTEDNPGYSEAMNGKFPDKQSEGEFKRIYAKVAAINRGAIDPTDTQFYFKQPEINKLIKSKGFDFSLVEEGEPFQTKNGKFRTFFYKK